MAKALKHSPPTSSVGRLLDKSAVARALSPASPLPQASKTCEDAPQISDFTDHTPKLLKREFVLTPTTEDALTRLVQVYRNATGTRLSNSHVIRAVLRGVAHGLSAIEREANCIGPLRLPSNAKGREAEREQFENMLTSSFIAAMRTLPSCGQA